MQTGLLERADELERIDALLALAQADSGDILLITGPADAALAWGERLSGALQPSVLVTRQQSGDLPAARGYPVKLCMPENVTPERKRILRAYGAELVLTDPLEGSDGAIRRVREIYQSDRDRYYYPDQYSNPANWRAHYETTGPEIIEQTGGRLTHFVAGLGTGGTFVGTGT